MPTARHPGLQKKLEGICVGEPEVATLKVVAIKVGIRNSFPALHCSPVVELLVKEIVDRKGKVVILLVSVVDAEVSHNVVVVLGVLRLIGHALTAGINHVHLGAQAQERPEAAVLVVQLRGNINKGI